VKSIALILLAVLLVLSLTLISCSSTPSTVVTTQTTTATTTAVTTATATATATTTTTNIIKPVKLVFSNWAPPPNAESIACHKWAKDFEAKTGGRYTVEVVDGGAIAGSSKGYDAVVNGICDISAFVPKESDKPFPIVNMSTLPVGFVTCETAYGAWFKLFKDGVFDKDLSGVKPLFTFIGNNEDVSTKKEVTTVDGFKGMKLVVPGGIQVDITKAVGAIPVMGGPPDAYELVSKGVADGIYIAALGMQEFQWTDLVKFLIKPMQFGKASHVIAMNKDVYNKMPADVKAIVDQMVADPQYGLSVAKGWDEWWNGSIKYFHDKGGKDVDWNQAEKDKLGALILPMWNKWINDNKASGSTAALTAYYKAMQGVGVMDPTPGWKP
jgi:TRAP-type transport system periplasmic protein